jgi:hypothetical protein
MDHMRIFWEIKALVNPVRELEGGGVIRRNLVSSKATTARGKIKGGKTQMTKKLASSLISRHQR